MEAIGNFKEDIFWSSTDSPHSDNPFADPTFGYSFYLFTMINGYLFTKMFGYSIYEWLHYSSKFASFDIFNKIWFTRFLTFN